MEYCVFVEPQQGASYADLRAFAQTAERLGFHGFFRSDHYLKMGPDFSGLPGPTDAWTSLAGLAVETERIRLGTLVSSVTYRAPGILAIQVANVDEMSAGRVELGLGTGWYAAEHAACGIPFPEKRFDLLEEQLAIVTGLWGTPAGETFTFAGEHYALEDSPALPKPVQASVPLIIGGGGPKRTPELAARFATEFNRFAGPAEAGEQFAGVRAACERLGRDPEDLRYSAAIQVVAGEGERYARRVRRQGGDPASWAETDGHAGGGTAAIVDRIAAYAELGAARVYLQLMDLQDLEHLEELGTEVLPHLP